MRERVPEEHRVARRDRRAGTATPLAAIAQALVPYDPEKVQGFVLDAGQIWRRARTGSRRCRWPSANKHPGWIRRAPRRSSPAR